MLTYDEISNSYEKFASQDEKEINSLLKQFQKKQMPLMVYLSAVSQREEWNDDEQEIFFGAALFLWVVLSKPSAQVSMERIEKADNDLFGELESHVGKEHRNLEERVEQMLDQSRQPNLLGFLVELLIEEDPEVQLRPDSQGIMLFTLRNMMDLLTEPAA